MLCPKGFFYVSWGAIIFLSIFQGVVVQAADPVGPDYFRTDLGSTATLQCPGVLRFSLPITSVSWFRGNSTRIAVKLDNRTSVSSDGKLVIQTVKKAERGWYSCRYTSPSGPVIGRTHLTLIDLRLDIFVIDPYRNEITHLQNMQKRQINIRENRIVVFDAKSTRGDDLTLRDPYWLFKGASKALRRPYFCYTGYILDSGESLLRMAMLTSVANFSGRYDIIAGGLSTYIIVQIRATAGEPAKILSNEKEEQYHISCDDTFMVRVKTHPPTTKQTTTTTTTTTTVVPSTSTSESTRRPNSPAVITTTTILWPVFAAAGMCVLSCCIIAAILCNTKRGAMTAKGIPAKKTRYD
ncbi:uncharacterized protein LOC135810833 isoform X2 [Sycon ciliatum]|uniref:uncharacterized protein LOC135810833 isoform X2 n=1 Tax=Sycon ciliatum TaxID=27933 RepID=UPI0031F677B9